MRFPTFPAIIRTFYILTTATTRPISASHKAATPFTRGTIVKSMPTLPFLGSLFSSSSSSRKMTYPFQKSDNEWQAVLNKGEGSQLFLLGYPLSDPETQSNSVYCAKKAPKPPTLASMTSTCPAPASTLAPAATLLCTKQLTNSNQVAVGLHTSTRFQAL